MCSNDPNTIAVPNGNHDVPTTNILKKKKSYYLRWHRIQKTVEIKDGGAGLNGGSISMRSQSFSESIKGKASIKKVILNQVSGYAAPGEVLALMGPSGSGKTSLLNAISGRSSIDSSSVISINGEALNKQTMKRLMSKVAYVKQADIFFEHLTVRDQLTYTALLRLPASMSSAQKHEEVDKMIALLRLNKVEMSPIFLLSGGEKKRVNIGTELLTDPLVLLLDEPTSGLDSTSAVSLLNLLKSLAREHSKTVITSIHQPSSAVFRSFDRLMFMCEGNVVYFGTPAHSLDYLRSLELTCPDGYNASDHWMDLLVNDSSVEQEREEQQEQEQADEEGQNHDTAELRRKQFITSSKPNRDSPRVQLQAAWDSEALGVEMDKALNENDKHSTTDDGSTMSLGSNASQLVAKQKKYPTSWITQYFILTHRSLKNSRSAIFTPLNLVKSVAIGLIAGLVWFQMEYTEANLVDRSAYFFFTMTYWVFDSMFAALMAFPQERVVLLKERASGSYHLSAYFMAKTTSDAPVRIALPTLYMIPSFWIAGIDNRFSMFLASTGCTLLSVIAGESIGLMVGALISDLQKAMTVMTVFSLGLMLLGGFFVQNIPNFISWAKYFSPFKYAFDASLQLVFNRDVPCDGSGVLEGICFGNDYGFAKSEDVKDFFGAQGSIGFNVLMLFAVCIVPRILAYVALRRQKHGER